MEELLHLCRRCGKHKSANDFNWTQTRNGTPALRRICGKCQYATRCLNGFREKPKFKRQARSDELKRKFGIVIEEYEELLAYQNYVCAICKRSQVEEGKSLAVDHCHKTGKIRGLLCGHCNRAIGGFCDSPEILRRAADYLEET